MAMHGYVPKKKKDAQDCQKSNEYDEFIANSFAVLKALSARSRGIGPRW